MNFKTTDDLTIFHDEIFESISIELQLDDKDKILIGVIYRPPNNKINEFTDELENFSIMKISNENKQSYGRFNYQRKNVNNSTGKHRIISFSCLCQVLWHLIPKIYIDQEMETVTNDYGSRAKQAHEEQSIIIRLNK